MPTKCSPNGAIFPNLFSCKFPATNASKIILKDYFQKFNSPPPPTTIQVHSLQEKIIHLSKINMETVGY